MHNPPNYKLQTTLTDHERAISCLKFSADGQFLASTSADANLRIWTAMGALPRETLRGHSAGINECSFCTDCNSIITASDDRTIRLWDIARGETVSTFYGHKDAVFCCAFNPRFSSAFVTGSFDGNVRMWDTKSGKCLRVIQAHSDPVTAVDVNRDGTFIISSSYDGKCQIWDTASSKSQRMLVDGGNLAISHARFSPNGRYVLISTFDDRIRIFDFFRSKPLKEYLGHKNNKFCLFANFSVTGGKFIVSGSEDHKVYVWHLQKKDIVQVLEGHKDTVICSACHPTDNFIATGGHENDRTIKLWRSDY
ncbi:hypothetical protein ACOME3_003724 [Neoechinorhynchus agilis]